MAATASSLILLAVGKSSGTPPQFLIGVSPEAQAAAVIPAVPYWCNTP